jgi:hypothetical protein
LLHWIDLSGGEGFQRPRHLKTLLAHLSAHVTAEALRDAFDASATKTYLPPPTILSTQSAFWIAT